MRIGVLSGGGARAAYEVGALRWLMADSNRDYDGFCGVSAGALNAAALAMTPIGHPAEAVDRLEAFWEDLRSEKVWRRRWCGDYIAALLYESVYDVSPLVRLVRENLDARIIAASGRTVRVGAVALEDGEYRSADERDPRFVDWVIASSAFPGFFPPVSIGGKTWADGGLRNITPLGEAIRLGATEIDVILCSNPDLPRAWPARGRKAYEVATRSVEIMGDEIARTDLQVAGLKNEVARLDETYREVAIRTIYPMKRLRDDPFDFSPEAIREMMEIGYEDAVWSDRA